MQVGITALGNMAIKFGRRLAPSPPVDLGDDDPAFHEIYRKCRPYTMTSIERMYAVYKAAQHVSKAGIPGAFVECGTWRGGSSMVGALALVSLNDTNRELWLYDTFSGMAEPTTRDRRRSDGAAALPRWKEYQRASHNEWDFATLEDVRMNLVGTGYPEANMRFIQGRVEDTIPGAAPEKISILRLDTDWYESTLHNLIHLYPRLASGGVLIVDDYGHWQGCREAVDEYLSSNGIHLLLNRIDYTGRMAIKP